MLKRWKNDFSHSYVPRFWDVFELFYRILDNFCVSIIANPLNWIYDGARIKSILEKHNPPEFCPEWACPFYKTDVGSFSTYGEQAFCTLKSIADNNGKLRVFL